MAGRFFRKASAAWIWGGVWFWSHILWAQSPTAPVGGAPATLKAAPMTDIHDIKPLTSLFFPGSFPKYAGYLVAGLFLAGVLFSVFRYWRKKSHPQNISPAEIILPPELVAGLALDELASDENLSDKAFYFRLSAILRVYLSGRFGVDGLEMTTEELLPAVERLGIDRGLKSGIKDFLLFSDPVKFAEFSAPMSRRHSDLEFARGLVKLTTADATEEETSGAREPLTPVGAGNNTA